MSDSARARSGAGVSLSEKHVDVAAGVAVLAMFAGSLWPTTMRVPTWAQVTPSALDAVIVNPVHLIAGPLLAVCIGLRATLVAQRGSHLIPSFVRGGLWAGVLVALGVWLEFGLGGGAGFLTVPASGLFAFALPALVAPMAGRVNRGLLLIGTALAWAAGPVTAQVFADDRQAALRRHDVLAVHLWDALFTGRYLRGVDLLVFAGLGVFLARWLSSGAYRVTVVALAAALTGAVVVLLSLTATSRSSSAASAHDGVHLMAYAPTRLAVAASAGMSLVVVCVVFLILHLPIIQRSWVSTAVAAMGAMPVTLYLAQSLYLAALGVGYDPGEEAGTRGSALVKGVEQPWASFVVLVIVAVLLPIAWHALTRRSSSSRVTRGPIEGPTAVVASVFR